MTGDVILLKSNTVLLIYHPPPHFTAHRRRIFYVPVLKRERMDNITRIASHDPLKHFALLENRCHGDYFRP